ncbi:ARG82 [Brettanomyces bruxellensis]|uniref:Kinase n=1 Tax=Dekkera bruxellensis TaxID=5007 RepID=A0A7D9D0Q0_DEKBR|nr:ARG82 [Brettanomyces bruxellensis]
MPLISAKHKAAGHEGPMQTEDGSLFCKPTSKQEVQFYTRATRESVDESLPLGSVITDWMPICYGCLTSGVKKDGKYANEAIEKIDTNPAVNPGLKEDGLYIVLQDVLYGFTRPNILDIKLGSILYDESASKDKVERMKNVSRTTTSGSLSFRICGMQMANDFPGKLPADIPGVEMKSVCKIQDDGYLAFNKFFGRHLNSDTVIKGLRVFFRYNRLSKDTQDQMIQTFTNRLMMFYNCILDTEFRAVSSSLLFVYENDQQIWEQKNHEDALIKETVAGESDEEDETEVKQNAPLSELKYIDFAHSKFTPGKGYDDEIAQGVENLIRLIKQI